MDSDEKPDDKNSPRWSEFVKDATAMGLGTLFLTEEAVRNYLKDKKLPKDVVSALLENVTRKKDDLYEKVAKEFGKILSKNDISREVGKFFETHHMHVEAKVSFSPKSRDKGEEHV